MLLCWILLAFSVVVCLVVWYPSVVFGFVVVDSSVGNLCLHSNGFAKHSVVERKCEVDWLCLY